MKTREREQARRLRQEQGLSIKQIEKLLGVARSSVSLWVRDIELSEMQREALADKAQRKRGASRVAHFRAKRLRYQRGGRAAARHGDFFHAAGCMLYWAEGSKGRNTAALTNSDPEVLRFFMAFLREYFSVPDHKVRVRCHLFPDHAERQRDVEQFRLDLLELPSECLTRSAVNVYSKYSQRKRINRLPYGTCRVAVHDTAILQHIYGAIQEYAGFERPEWIG
jgi:Helix-turn-helix